jgi:membrane-bound lytic murein transglycosylase D
MRLTLIYTFVLLSSLSVIAQDTLLPDGVIRDDDPVMYQLDQLLLQGWAVRDSGSTYTEISDESFTYPTEEEIELRLMELDKLTPVELTYNKVVSAYIKMYAVKKKSMTSEVLGRAKLYYPMFEQVLDNEDMPLEIKHLAVVESALNPVARSRVGASGLWQFMLPTGRHYGLKVNSYIDERFDPLQSTKAAAAYLKYLHGIYNDWNMALAAYNCGPGNVNKAIRRSGGKRDYWKIYPYLPRETRGYVPAFIAVNYVMANTEQLNIAPVAPKYVAYEVDTLNICYGVNFTKIAEYAGIPVEDVMYLNPKYKKGIIPEPFEPVTLNLPASKVGAYLANEENICYFRSERELELAAETARANEKPETESVVHVVRHGQSLGLIAQRYGVSVRSIMNDNGLRSTRIRTGQRLRIEAKASAVNKPEPVATNPVAKSEPVTDKQEIDKDVDYFFHTIKSGDTVWDIAKLYSGVSVDQIKNLNQGVNFRRLAPGDKIRIPSS